MASVSIRTRLTVLRDGSTIAAPVAFCAADGQSVPLSRCATCGFGSCFERDERGRFASLACSRVAEPRSPDESGDRAQSEGRASAPEPRSMPVGRALTRPFVCLAEDALVVTVARFFESESTAFGLPVVDGRGRLVGTLARATAALALAGSRRGRVVGEMLVPSRVVSERASVAATFASMRERSAQEIAVLGDDRALVGVLRDIDALRILARSARSDADIQLAG